MIFNKKEMVEWLDNNFGNNDRFGLSYSMSNPNELYSTDFRSENGMMNIYKNNIQQIEINISAIRHLDDIDETKKEKKNFIPIRTLSI